jgi:hypothetical protein
MPYNAISATKGITVAAGSAGQALIGTGVTDNSGVATYLYTLPWTVGGGTPCTTNYFVANTDTKWSNVVSGKAAYPTRISISAPDKVTARALYGVIL